MNCPMTETLGDALPAAIHHVREEILPVYESICADPGAPRPLVCRAEPWATIEMKEGKTDG